MYGSQVLLNHMLVVDSNLRQNRSQATVRKRIVGMKMLFLQLRLSGDTNISVEKLMDMELFDVAGRQTLPPLLSEIPSHLFRVPELLPRRRRRRHRGRRSGRLVKLKSYMTHCSTLARSSQGSFLGSRRWPSLSCCASEPADAH
ncbi:unnamed protein product [Menidia menidia]|uniref:(Atlantic silverside) hypothetical protein n=1 Tax=Menidia menidia TaxID=238744 RepID=A0A8S4ARS3_9TELE|nr:unnamed protein product [Menidia menidia]